MRREAEMSMQETRSAPHGGRPPRARRTVGGLAIFDVAAAALLSCVVLAFGSD